MRKRSVMLLVVAALFACTALAVSQGRGQGRGQAPALPDGPGKEVLQSNCMKCHGANLIVNSGGYTRQDWVGLFSTMVSLPADQRDAIADYLAKNFPEQPRPAPVVLSGPVKINIKEWNVPTLGSRPHDPEPGPDGSIWWTGMFANVIGRFNPKTGEMKEFPLKTPNSGPHGLVNDKAGNIWFTANTGGYVGKLDPKSGNVTEYKMPDPAARDPHTPIFDKNGMLFFTVQAANMVGRLN